MFNNINSCLVDLVAPNLDGFENHDPFTDNSEPAILNISEYIDDTNGLVNALKKSTFNILSLNCQSVNAKFCNLCTLLDRLAEHHCEISIICLQESWLGNDSDVSLLKIPGYELVNQPLKISKHGGLIMYISNNLKFKNVASFNSNVWENHFVEVSFDKHIITVGNIYRPPNRTNDAKAIATFCEEFKSCLNSLAKKSHTVLAGDYNIDLLKIHENDTINSYLDSVLSQGFIPSITRPTRFSVQHGTSSLIG